MMNTDSSLDNNILTALEFALRERIHKEEVEYFQNNKKSGSLWGHSKRVALIAERIGLAERVDKTASRLAGFFHDAGKFWKGGYHKDDKPEEERSAQIFREITRGRGLKSNLIDKVEEAILQLYRNDSEPTHLTKVLFDADNLDKLGCLGIGNFFVKTGLRSGGISPALLYHLTVELTYARHAPNCLATKTGREIARKRAPETITFFKRLLECLREDGLFDFRVTDVTFNNLSLDVVAPVVCDCGEKLSRRIWEVPGIKCPEIHLEHTCQFCGLSHELRFCRPRLIT